MPKKIFELAKELDIAPLELVEQLKEKGHKVRNHMSSLADDVVAEVLAAHQLKGSKPAGDKPKVTKKKAAKKKATKASKASGGDLKAKKTDDDDVSKPKTVKRKKIVVRKTSAKGQVESAEADQDLENDKVTSLQEQSEETSEIKGKSSEDANEVEASSTESVENKLLGEETASKETDGAGKVSSSGLRVVSRPKTQLIKKVEAKAKVEEPADTKDYYEEKVHTFTPVFIPEKDENDSKPEARKKTTEGAAAGDDDDDDEKRKGKKRLGNLATMMSGKKAVVSKSQVLNQSRADSELKSYAALSGIGRPIYTQIRKKRAYMGPASKTELTEVKEAKRVIQLHKGGTVTLIAHKLSAKVEEVIDAALDLNLLLAPNDFIGMGLATEIAAIFNYRVEDKAFDEKDFIGEEELTAAEVDKLPLRDPIITIMGHVDHGKTTLLDYIRKAKVAQGEAGGITQHIGAYTVEAGGKNLTFLDTPGHAAFAAMRQRGADITDIVILVVAADDGVMPQTKESVRFCQSAGVPIIVAVNKMDKEGVNPDRIKQELAEFSITPEEWGGDTQFVPISALKGDGVDELLEAVALQAEILELRADPTGAVEGIVIESKIEQGRGPVATILIQKGTLSKGVGLIVGETFGRARSLTDFTGKDLKSAGPSTPVQILGLETAPNPGDMLNVVKNEREARKIVDNRINERKILEAIPTEKRKVSLEDFFADVGEVGGVERKQLNLIVRSDVQGSFQAIKESVVALSNKEVEVKMLSGGVGPITDSDISLASSAKAYVLGFNMRPVTSARKLSEQLGIDIRTYSIIYELIDEVKLAIEGLLEPIHEENYIGRAEVKETFIVPKIGNIAGSIVVDGKIQVGCNIRLLRNGKIMHDGSLSSLKRFKDDVKEVKSGLECGIALKDFTDIKVGDLFEAYQIIKKKRSYEEMIKDEEREAQKQAEALKNEQVNASSDAQV